MKKFLSIIVVMIMAFLLVACGGSEVEWKIVMITDVGTITDKSFNQGTYEGVEAFAEEFDISYQYFRPNDATQKDYEEAIDLSIANGANVIVTPGFLFETAIFTAQTKYPDVHFILIDGQPHSGDYTPVIKDNTVSILFQEEQSGFLAGYAAVADGYTKLGFMGGMAVPAVKKFGIGYIAGAYYAAKELSKTITFDANRYEYLGDFNNDPKHTTKAASWYDAGVEVIFAAAGGAGNAVMAAAEQKTGKKVIGVDIDQSSESTTVITSAMKQLATAVYQELDALINKDSFSGGKALMKGAAEDAVGLPQDTSKFNTFTKTQYDAVYKLVKDGTVVVPKSMAELTTFLKDKAGNPSVADLVAKTEPAA